MGESKTCLVVNGERQEGIRYRRGKGECGIPWRMKNNLFPLILELGIDLSCCFVQAKASLSTALQAGKE